MPRDTAGWRPLTTDERSLLERMLSGPVHDGELLRKSIQDVPVRSIDDEGSIEFKNRPNVPGSSIPVEAYWADHDGGLVYALLHVLNRRVIELEIYKDDSSSIVRHFPGDDLKIEIMQQ